MCLLDKTDTPNFVSVVFWPVNQNLHKQRSVKLPKMTRISVNGWHKRKTNNLIWLRHYTFILIFIFITIMHLCLNRGGGGLVGQRMHPRSDDKRFKVSSRCKYSKQTFNVVCNYLTTRTPRYFTGRGYVLARKIKPCSHREVPMLQNYQVWSQWVSQCHKTYLIRLKRLKFILLTHTFRCMGTVCLVNQNLHPHSDDKWLIFNVITVRSIQYCWIVKIGCNDNSVCLFWGQIKRHFVFILTPPTVCQHDVVDSTHQNHHKTVYQQ